MCDTNPVGIEHHVEWLRPIEVTFHGYSPYLIEGEPQTLNKDWHEEWTPFPIHIHSSNPHPNDKEIKAWASENRKNLWNNNLWGEMERSQIDCFRSTNSLNYLSSRTYCPGR